MPKIVGNIGALLADKAYDADQRVIDALWDAGVEIVIPPKANRRRKRKYDKEKYNRRHLIENFFAKPKHCRAIATRYDKRASVYLGAVRPVASIILLK